MKNIILRLIVTSLFIISVFTVAQVTAQTQINIPPPAGSGRFGGVETLPNGNIIISDSEFSLPTAPFTANVGAVYMYNGATGAMISRLTGSNAGDRIGGAIVLPNGNFVVLSNIWNNFRGAITYCDGTTGCNGIVSTANSLVGSTPQDFVGNGGIGFVILPNGNYVAITPNWDNGGIVDAGAVTFCNGTTGCTGVVSAANSLVGSQPNDRVGSNSGLAVLPNSNYVVNSNVWDNGSTVDAGASTFCNGTTGCTGPVTTANSLVGLTANENVGTIGAVLNNNYVATAANWDNGAINNVGAVRLCSNTTGCTGIFTAVNSLIGSTVNDQVGSDGFNAIRALPNGNFIVRSPVWDNGAVVDAGAVTFCNSTTGCAGQIVSAANSLVGSTTNNRVSGATVLPNSNYVVNSGFETAAGNVGAATFCNGSTGCIDTPSAANALIGSSANDLTFLDIRSISTTNYIVSARFWRNGAAANAGAVTFCNSTTGCTNMVVSDANSLVGSLPDDQIGSRITVLNNNNYVVSGESWDNGGIANVGAVTLCNGTSGCTGAVSLANSLVGSAANERVGTIITALTNSNYVVANPQWDNGATDNVGAVRLCNGTTGCTGIFSSANSIIGSTNNDQVGSLGITSLINNNYVVNSEFWDSGALTNVGAITRCNGTTGCIGVVSATNSLVGSRTEDRVGAMPADEVFLPNRNGVRALINGDYVVESSFWDNGAIANARAITYGNGNGGTVGEITSNNSVLGNTTFSTFRFVYDSVNNQLIVSRPFQNIVTLFRPATTGPTPTPTPTPTATPTPPPSPTPTPTPTPGSEIDLRISQSDAPDPVMVGQPLTYTLTVFIRRFSGQNNVSPQIRFNYPSGVPFVFNSANGTDGYSATPDANGVTFSGGAFTGIGDATGTFNIIITPQAAGTLTSLGSNVIVDPTNVVFETNENNNTATTITTTVNTNNVCTPTTTVTEGDLFPGGIVSFGVTSGPGSVTVDHVNAGTGLQSLTVVGVPVNAVVTIPPFTAGTTAPVVVTFTTPMPGFAVDFTLRAASTFHAANIRVRCAETCTPTTTVTEGDLFPGGIVSFGVSSGPGTVTIDHVNAGTGLQSLTVMGTPTNATVFIPAFTPGTTAPVVVGFLPTNPALPVDFTLRAASTFHAAFIRVRCGTPPPPGNLSRKLR